MSARGKFADMPKNAMATGCVDFVLSPLEIARELARIAGEPYLSRSDTSAIRKESKPKRISGNSSPLMHHATGVDFSLYRQSTAKTPRPESDRHLLNLKTLKDYVEHLKQNPSPRFRRCIRTCSSK